MKPFLIGMLLLLGGCAVAPGPGAAPNYGGDINSANGKAWLAKLAAADGLWSTKTGNGYNNWEKGSDKQNLNPATGDITGFHLTVSGEKSVFLGAPSPTTAFYMMPRYGDQTVESGFVEAQVYGVFLSNVTDQDSGPKTLIYQAALKLTAAQINAFKAQVGIPSGDDVEEATTEQQKRYNALVHRPENYDLTKPAAPTSTGEKTQAPLSILIPKP